LSASTSAEPSVARIRASARLRGELRLPGDKSVSHRALILAALAAGESRIEGAGDGADVRSTAGIVAALGASVERLPGVGATVGKPQVAYRETISIPAHGVGRFVRQSGGRGQYGHVELDLEPNHRTAAVDGR